MDKQKEDWTQLRRHYEIEKKLAAKLRNASKEERHSLYGSLYDELFREVPNHVQLLQKTKPELQRRAVYRKMLFLKRFLKPDSTFLEVGAGDCKLSREVAEYVKNVVAIDVSEEITKNEKFPTNFRLLVSDASTLPVPQNSIDIVYSDNLMEHLHPEDCCEQLESIYEALKVGGKYVCITPNRITGPHDVSRYFDDVATGFHLKEYTVDELCTLFAETGFTEIKAYVGGRGVFLRFPATINKSCERILCSLPHSLKKRATRMLPTRMLLGITVIAKK